jgi:hypothetical protein
MDPVWLALISLVALYCVVRAVVDFRKRQYVWAALSLCSAAVIILLPFPTHSVDLDLPKDQQ